MNKKKVGAVLASSLSFVFVTAICLIAFLPTTYNYDKGLIKTNPNYDVYKLENKKYTTIVKESDGDFKILGFTDLHLDRQVKKATTSVNMMIRNVVNEKPDLIVFDGDIISSGFNKRRTKQFVDIMNKLGVYWTIVLGNHEGDNPVSASRETIVNLYSKSKYCLIDTSAKHLSSGEHVEGIANHVVNLAKKNGDVYQSLYLIDSGQGLSEKELKIHEDEIDDIDHNSYDYIKESQINWYKETVTDINKINNSVINSMMFAHIPLTEYKLAYEEITGENEVTIETPNYNVPNENGDYIISGLRREVICHPYKNSGMFNALKEMGSTKAFIAGHDHINDFVLSYQGIKLGYNQSSGYSGYNVVTKGLGDTIEKGYSIYKVHSNGDIDWDNIRNSDVWPDLQKDILKLYK